MWAPTREQAIKKLQRALGEICVVGVPTTIPVHQAVLANESFMKGEEVYTNFIEKEDILQTVKDNAKK